jgi:hypothetical protein
VLFCVTRDTFDKSSIFWDVRRHGLAVGYLRLGTSYLAGLMCNPVAAVTNCQVKASDGAGSLSVACSVSYKAADEFP